MEESAHTGGAIEELRCITRSPGETVALGRRLGALLVRGDLVCLFGELGSGKTCLVRGLVQGMGVDQVSVTSPSFILVNQYKGRFPIYHIDLYRFDSPAEAEEVGLREFLSEDGVALIEWASRIESELPQERLDLVLSHLSETVREVRLILRGQSFRARSKVVGAAVLKA